VAFPIFDPARQTYNIYAANIDGAYRRLLVQEASQPAFSPDGNRIAYRSWKGSDRRIIAMGINGRDLLRLTHYHEDAHPDWSSEGLLVFHSKREGDRVSRIYTVGTWIGAQDQVLDGNRVAFSSGRDGNWEIYTLTVQGGQLNRLTDDPADDWMPAWSPDGQYIAFVSNRDGDWALWAMRADGSSQTRLFSLEGIPDGRVRDAPDYTSVGWSEERISWAP